jgi:uncharacterized protein YjbI with pentapeptide repeats
VTPRSKPPTIGITQPPEVDVAELGQDAFAELVGGVELEEARLQSMAFVGVDAGSVRMERVHLLEVELDESKLRGLKLVDALCEGVSAANGDWGGAQLKRVRFEGGRMTGLNMGEARIEDVEFSNCKLDYANFRHGSIDHVTFEDCVLTEADFQGATIGATRFSGCQLREADFSNANLSNVDMTGSDLGLAGSVLGLGGAIIDSLQLMELSAQIAHELGIVVKEA